MTSTRPGSTWPAICDADSSFFEVEAALPPAVPCAAPIVAPGANRGRDDAVAVSPRIVPAPVPPRRLRRRVLPVLVRVLCKWLAHGPATPNLSRPCLSLHKKNRLRTWVNPEGTIRRTYCLPEGFLRNLRFRLPPGPPATRLRRLLDGGGLLRAAPQIRVDFLAAAGGRPVKACFATRLRLPPPCSVKLSTTGAPVQEAERAGSRTGRKQNRQGVRTMCVAARTRSCPMRSTRECSNRPGRGCRDAVPQAGRGLPRRLGEAPPRRRDRAR